VFGKLRFVLLRKTPLWIPLNMGVNGPQSRSALFGDGIIEFLAQLSEVKVLVQRHFNLCTDVLTTEAADTLTATPSGSACCYNTWRIWSNLR
jgi:hypothetical protein